MTREPPRPIQWFEDAWDTSGSPAATDGYSETCGHLTPELTGGRSNKMRRRRRRHQIARPVQRHVRQAGATARYRASLPGAERANEIPAEPDRLGQRARRSRLSDAELVRGFVVPEVHLVRDCHDPVDCRAFDALLLWIVGL